MSAPVPESGLDLEHITVQPAEQLSLSPPPAAVVDPAAAGDVDQPAASALSLPSVQPPAPAPPAPPEPSSSSKAQAGAPGDSAYQTVDSECWGEDGWCSACHSLCTCGGCIPWPDYLCCQAVLKLPALLAHCICCCDCCDGDGGCDGDCDCDD